jgi:phenylpropionate dioxygenase-like ring-hydroxylating dioxygenase large terminal subunit
MRQLPASQDDKDGNDNDRTLPAWIYNDQGFFELEKQKIFNSNWIIACHISEIPNSGDFITFSFMKERALVTRMDDGSIKAVHNTCRHRAHQVVAAPAGNCKRVHICPYHGWTYNVDGSLRGIPGGTDSQFKQAGCGLPKIESEIFAGFVWIRFGSEGPSVPERLAPFAKLLEGFQIETMVPNHDLVVEQHDVDWKNMMDNYLEGYHVTMGHPALSEMMETAYDVTSDPVAGTSFATHRLRDTPNGGPDEREYLSTLPPFPHLPDDHARRWSYLSLFPNVNIGLQPDCVDFFVIYPIGPGRAEFRSASYSLPTISEQGRKAREASGRIWAIVQEEDNNLTKSVQGGLEGSSYQYGILSPSEPAVRAFRDWIQHRLPIAKQAQR